MKLKPVKALPTSNSRNNEEFLITIKKGNKRHSTLVYKRGSKLVFWDAEDSRKKSSYLKHGDDVDFNNLTDLYSISYGS